MFNRCLKKETEVPRKTIRRKHVPQRTCIGCREVLPKRTLIRIVRTQDGIKIDPTGKLSGRGAYLHEKHSCWERAIKGALASALKKDLEAVDREMLLAFMTTLPDDSDSHSESPAKSNID